ncbi:MAG: glutamate-5-semialdehyde dehydrogenase [Clostridiales bacterium]|nr:glutamate-5-semialdehyde dehydrogenase [Clostridiales bacterium]
MNTTLDIMKRAKAAAPEMAVVSEDKKNEALNAMADMLLKAEAEILEANKIDVENSQGIISPVMIDRLTLTSQRIKDMAKGIREVADLPDPVGKVLRSHELPNGLVVNKTSVPLGVIAIIYESRPNVTSDAAALALKSGNACILRGGKEAFHSANAIVGALQRGLCQAGLSEDLVQLIQDTTRASANELMNGVGYIDLLIPRGGKGLIQSCVDNAKVPCIQTGTGICHIYVDEFADLEKAINIVENAKTSRPSVCNAAEVCLVHEKVADIFLAMMQQKLVDDRKARGQQPVEFRDDEFSTEFLDYIMAVKTVGSVKEAVEHIAAHSTGHSEAIVTENSENAQLFVKMVDSAAVYVNASTRFTDGGEFGLGCEMGISTQKLHARGPMGLEELTSYKYVVYGNGQIR